MGGEILLGGRFADVCAHFAGGDVEAGDEGTGAVSMASALTPRALKMVSQIRTSAVESFFSRSSRSRSS